MREEGWVKQLCLLELPQGGRTFSSYWASLKDSLVIMTMNSRGRGLGQPPTRACSPLMGQCCSPS